MRKQPHECAETHISTGARALALAPSILPKHERAHHIRDARDEDASVLKLHGKTIGHQVAHECHQWPFRPRVPQALLLFHIRWDLPSGWGEETQDRGRRGRRTAERIGMHIAHLCKRLGSNGIRGRLCVQPGSVSEKSRMRDGPVHGLVMGTTLHTHARCHDSPSPASRRPHASRWHCRLVSVVPPVLRQPACRRPRQRPVDVCPPPHPAGPQGPQLYLLRPISRMNADIGRTFLLCPGTRGCADAAALFVHW